ncbi:MAG: metal-dependent hydrolase, partial [Bacteroidota bacterium]
MDSITQITLGAAVGEAVLGKKIGNRAMLWGAFGGTIPDLDIVANFVTDTVGATAFHRGITHSFFFALLAPLVLGWLLHRLYDGKPRSIGTGLRDLSIVFGVLAILNIIGAALLPIPTLEVIPIGLVVSAAITSVLAITWLNRRRTSAIVVDNPSTKGWISLFFWTILTHPLLDACTIYGTQLLQPFSDLRLGIDNISVADPAYTIPFIICLIIASRLAQTSRARSYINWIGIALSSAYMVFTFFNKQHVHQVFADSLAAEQISYTRLSTNPTILNNVLWQGVAESDSMYYHGDYSILDKEKRVLKFTSLPKNHHLLAP